MRIAHLGSKGIPSRGGTERVVEAIAVRHARTHRVTVYGSSAVCPHAWHSGVRVIPIRQPAKKHVGPVFLQLAAALHALVRGGFDVVHVHGSENGFVVPLLRLRYPVVTTNHGPAYEREKWSPAARAVIRFVEAFSVRPATVATAVADNQARSLSTRYGRQVCHIPNGVGSDELCDRDGARRLLGEVGLRERDYVLFAAARVDPTKGCHTLLEAIAGMDEPPKVLIVGDLSHAPGYETRLRALAEGLPVTFQPRLDEKAVLLGLLAQCRIFVFPSTVEAMSMMLLEALCEGALTLASDIPENTSIIPPEVRTFRAGDADDLRIGLLALLDQDEGSRREYSEAVRSWVSSRYDWDAIAREYLDVYGRALDS